MVKKYRATRKRPNRRYKRKVPMAIAKYVNKVVNKNEETKMWLSNPITMPVKQSTLLWAAPLQALRQGTQSTERVGKKIHVNNVIFKGIVEGALNLYETFFRCIVFEADIEAQRYGYVAGAENHTWTNDTSKTLENKVFLNPSANLYAYLNNSKSRIISDKVIKVHKDVMQNLQAPVKPFILSARVNRDVTYSENASYSAPNGKQLYFAVTAHSYGTTDGTDIAKMLGTFMVTFKDA